MFKICDKLVFEPIKIFKICDKLLLENIAIFKICDKLVLEYIAIFKICDKVTATGLETTTTYFVYELNGCWFESRSSHLNFRYRA